jgi:predicted nuclease of restriction endonuclease-like RecB superfamily
MSQMTKDEVREKLGNIDQIRDIIFGAQMREYDARLEQMRSDMGKHQQEVGDRLDHLKTNLTSEIKSGFESLEKKLKTFNTNHAEEAADLRQQIERLNRKLSSSVEDLDTALEEKTKAIKTELTEVRDQYQGEILMLRDMILAELEDRSKQLQAGKVSRFDMAEALFEMGLRLQGSEMIPTLQSAVDQQSAKTVAPTNESLRKPVKPEKAAV